MGAGPQGLDRLSAFSCQSKRSAQSEAPDQFGRRTYINQFVKDLPEGLHLLWMYRQVNRISGVASHPGRLSEVASVQL